MEYYCFGCSKRVGYDKERGFHGVLRSIGEVVVCEECRQRWIDEESWESND